MKSILKSTLSCMCISLALTACEIREKPASVVDESAEKWQAHLEAAELDPKQKVAIKETIYVPVYAHIYFDDEQSLLEMAETVSVRNTDQEHPIILTAVKHYSTDGKLLKSYLKTPVILRALGTADFVVPRQDTAGGTGANFIVEWQSKDLVAEPVVEAIMISTGSSHSVSFISRGVVTKRKGPKSLSETD